MPWIAVVLELDMRWSSHKGYVLGMPKKLSLSIPRCTFVFLGYWMAVQSVTVVAHEAS